MISGRKVQPIQLEHQPRWAQRLLENETTTSVETDEPGVRQAPKVRSRADLLELIGRGGGGGLVVDTALLDSYPEAKRDVEALVKDEKVRHVAQALDFFDGKGGSKRRRICAEFPMGIVLFQRLEPEIEALRPDEDIREAYHAAARLKKGDVRTRVVAPKAEAAKAKRAPSNRKIKKMQNEHMMKD
uniref:Uncharacterized protein n=1 Tax=Noctiluca scintillans TaxID=2966 RepID=A0A7S1A1X1_NOCSC|mmetsp:Transcript_27840/g.73562  ORF Transcript_27840/g.73562 Transcript_27840/m.73562 type:complete len:186 (+) Transcript_27840:84-641(+)|eukprot:CAMPEP_0194533062 /NCGR_PEP_ID=MMETSP0253-20130528/70836_1 /TAXON_ID=2966 /ORGANISM="Noctiluca scintillans" /LENGTH=185 /DNA_ID=CAMNT_0039378581 /DNA_START=27 /DNA_END=584 /DNA_ORIENTATION=-